MTTSNYVKYYMLEKGCWDKLIGPLNGVNDIAVLKPLDAYLNQDLHVSFGEIVLHQFR